MKSLFAGFFFLTLPFSQLYSQVPNAAANLEKQANTMGAAFITADYKTFASYTYPPILKSMGGATKMAETMNQFTSNAKANGMSFNKVTFDKPSKIIVAGKELQATIAEHLEIGLSQGRLVNTSTLIAMSMDNGTTWTFIDTSNKDMATLHKALPNLSSSLVVPPMQEPVRYNN